MPSLKAKRVTGGCPAPSDGFHLLPRPKARFTVAHAVRPVGDVIGRIVQVTIRELDQQSVAPPSAIEKPQTSQIARPRRGGRLDKPVPDDLSPHPPEETYRLPE